MHRDLLRNKLTMNITFPGNGGLSKENRVGKLKLEYITGIFSSFKLGHVSRKGVVKKGKWEGGGLDSAHVADEVEMSLLNVADLFRVLEINELIVLTLPFLSPPPHYSFSVWFSLLLSLFLCFCFFVLCDNCFGAVFLLYGFNQAFHVPHFFFLPTFLFSSVIDFFFFSII